MDPVNVYSPQALVSAPAVETASGALAAQAKALVEARYLVAFSRPRDLDVVRQSLLKECRRPGFADSAIYHKPIGNGVEGPSIRFAEAAIRILGNILPETTTVYDDNGRRIARVSVTDLEANVTYSQDVTITKTVERKSLKRGEVPLRTRINSQKEILYILEATDDDILNKQNALISKALRTLGLRLLPGDIQDECMALCRKTRAAEAANDPEKARNSLFDGFAGLGVPADQVKEFIGHQAVVLSNKEYSELKGLYTALRDGETTWREIMDSKKPVDDPKPPQEPKGEGEPKPSDPASGLKAAIKGSAKQAPASEPPPPPVETPKEAPPASAPPVPEEKTPWLDEPKKKLLFLKAKKNNPPVTDPAVVLQVIETLDGFGKAEGKRFFDFLADDKPEAVKIWEKATLTVAAKVAAAAPPPPPPPPPSDNLGEV